ncbi:MULTISPECIES: signal peptidase I [unclassified Arenimonas]|uniref:signal peptidase I n=1 Tax=unclassified Arenimonas TaxID=2641713 RepID=UPI00086E36C5|nr:MULTISPECIES: signal peptidase I [unclassified Arenimonas]ODS64853.1 MAG: signal peptidase I [Arenimonas sp. SCN 70-307]
MKIDLALILTVLSAVTGLVWLVDRLAFAPKRRLMQAEGEEVAEPVLVDYARQLFPIIFIVLVLRSFLAEPFRIPSSSMMPTLLVGDFILVNKFTYGIRLPVANTKIIEMGSPARGDVVVFRYPGYSPEDERAGTDYIKRIVGLPGDRIAFRDQTLLVNGQPVAKQAAGVYIGSGQGRAMTGATQYEVDLGEGRKHLILEESRFSNPRAEGEWVVPEGHFFAMGDNRDRSEDSRWWGFVPEENLVGKAFVVWLNCEGWFCSGAFDYTRIGDTIR